jgi:hypothetical protein
MVKKRVWKQAWAGRLKPWHALPGQQILCIGCLEKRLGRTLVPSDFIKAPVNDPAEFSHSDRLLNRLGQGGGMTMGDTERDMEIQRKYEAAMAEKRKQLEGR